MQEEASLYSEQRIGLAMSTTPNTSTSFRCTKSASPLSEQLMAVVVVL